MFSIEKKKYKKQKVSIISREIFFDKSFEIEQILFVENFKNICNFEIFLESSNRSKFKIINSIKFKNNIETYINFHVVLSGHKNVCCNVLMC